MAPSLNSNLITQSNLEDFKHQVFCMYVAPILITEERTIMVRVRTQMKIWFDKGTLLNFQNSRTDINSKVQSMSAALQKIVKNALLF